VLFCASDRCLIVALDCRKHKCRRGVNDAHENIWHRNSRRRAVLDCTTFMGGIAACGLSRYDVPAQSRTGQQPGAPDARQRRQ
jgi:uncharacterized protein (DUF169 family)